MAESDKIAIVTGAARGIGREIARELLSMGMTVVAADVRDDLLAELAEALGSPGEKLYCRKLYLTDGATGC